MEESDIHDVYVKLNSKYVKKYYVEDERKMEREYIEWYKHAIESPNFFMYIIRDKNGDLKGSLKFEVSGLRAIINIQLDSSIRGKKLSYLFIEKGINLITQEKKIKFLEANILKENDVSKHIFEKLGFKFIKNSNYNGIRHMLYRVKL